MAKIFNFFSTDANSRNLNTRNTYLVCRMFWCDDAVHSDVCWNDPQPMYNFSQVRVEKKMIEIVDMFVFVLHVEIQHFPFFPSDCTCISFSKSARKNEEQLYDCGSLG